MKIILKRIIACAALALFAFTGVRAHAAFPTTVTQAELQAKYLEAAAGGEKVKVLVMPGHEPTYGGAVLGTLTERDLMVDVGYKLAAQLSTDPRVEVTVARDRVNWNSDLSRYFETGWKSIERFVASQKKAFNKAVKKGDVEVRDFEPAHNAAATDVALRLYGISKWANEEGYDLAVHLHLNDTGAQNHQGFAVYIPDKEYGNAAASRPLGVAIASELNRYNASSTLPIENYAIVEDQSLIALGAYNTAPFPSVLIEYAYIYEPKIKNVEARDTVLSDMAHQTYRGIERYLGATVTGNDTLALPYKWVQGTPAANASSPQAYALQVALKKLGFFPPAGQLLVGCPISGVMDTCTVTGLKAFQKSKGLEQTGALGPRTIAALKTVGY